MNKISIATIGAGNMAASLLRPMKPNVSRFFAYTPSHTKAKNLAQYFEGRCVESLEEFDSIQEDLDVLFLGFKPQQFESASTELLEKMGGVRNKDLCIVSMLAGTPLEVIKNKFKTDNVIRIMPNTPSQVGLGVTLMLPHDNCDSAVSDKLKTLLECAGPVAKASSEDQLDDWTSVSGSGPAYVFEFARIYKSFLMEKGMDDDLAQEVVTTLFLGCSTMMKENTDTSFETLRENVTSKKGVTFEALESLKEANLEKIIYNSLEANIKRSHELRNEALKKG